MIMNASAWRSEQHDGYVYVVQINEIKHGDNSVISNIFENWKKSSEGWNLKNNSRILILTKKFNSEKEWKEWAKTLPFKMVEYKYRAGKQKVIELSCKSKKKREKNAKKE